MLKKVEALMIKKGKKEFFEEKVVNDIEFTIKISGKLAGRLNCLPCDLDFLGWGFLVSGGWIETKEDVKDFKVSNNVLNVSLRKEVESELASHLSSCGKEVVFVRRKSDKDLEKEKQENKLNGKFYYENIISIMKDFQKSDILHSETGATHSAGIGCEKKLLFSIADVGRNNAFQKVIGKMFLEKIPPENKIILTTGRISREMVTACSQVSIPVIVSKSAPMLSAIKAAEQEKITLIGFAKGDRMTCFSCWQRVEGS